MAQKKFILKNNLINFFFIFFLFIYYVYKFFILDEFVSTFEVGFTLFDKVIAILVFV